MEWLSDPTVWVGLLTLVALELVLGVDNLIFIAILADRLPPEQRDRARILGLTFALAMRLALLGSIAWMISLKEPIFSLWRFEFSWRDLILIGGGMFLLIKATTEIHDRIEPGPSHAKRGVKHAAFWPIVAQIVVIDAVFSIDSIVTAVGMVDELYVMMAAVVVAILAMLVASKPLTAFITARPSLIILCLGFLLMVGLVLVVDGFGLHIPKGYLYAAIAFSALVELLNQLAARGRRRAAQGGMTSRQQVADAVLRFLAGVPLPAYALPEGKLFGSAEREMVGGVLTLRERAVSAIMTARADVAALGLDEAGVLEKIRANPHREFPVLSGDEVHGVVRKEDVLALCIDGKPIELKGVLREAPAVSARASVLDALNKFKRTTAELALVLDERGRFQGIVTRTDLLEAIAGEFPDEGE